MEGFCYKTASIWQFVGYIVLVLKIIVPLVIIILGIVDLVKAIISDADDKTLKNYLKVMSKRIIAGIAIFFVPTIINYLFSLVGAFTNSVNDNHMNCVTCVTSPNNCDTSYKGEIFNSNR